jgi:hypothetical protein
MEDPFATFVKEMLDSKQWSEHVDDEVRAQLEQDLRTRLMDQIDRAIVEQIPEDKIDGLNELLDREVSEEEIQQYVAGSGVDTKQIALETMVRFRDLYLAQEPTEEDA